MILDVISYKSNIVLINYNVLPLHDVKKELVKFIGSRLYGFSSLYMELLTFIKVRTGWTWQRYITHMWINGQIGQTKREESEFGRKD